MPEVGPARSPEAAWGASGVVAVDLGATHLRVALGSPNGFERVAIRRTEELARRDGEGVARGVVETVVELCESTGVSRPRAAGVGVAAFVDRAGVVLQPREFGIVAGPILRDSLQQALGVPVVVDNDANLAAFAEVSVGAARGVRDAAVLTLGTNIGLGIVADGRIVRGAHGAAGEAGTLLVPVRRGRGGRAPYAQAGRLGAGTTTAPAGYAILEELVGGGALLRWLEKPPRSGGADAPERAITSGGIFPRAASGSRRARLAVRHGVEGWAMLIANLVALLDPEVVVLSGGLVEEAPAFIGPLRRRAAELCSLPPEIRIGELGSEAGLVGAALVAASAAPERPGATQSDRVSAFPAHDRGCGRTFTEGEVGA